MLPLPAGVVQVRREFYRLVRERLPHAVVLCTVHRADELDQFDRVLSLAELSAPADAGQ